MSPVCTHYEMFINQCGSTVRLSKQCHEDLCEMGLGHLAWEVEDSPWRNAIHRFLLACKVKVKSWRAQ